MGRFSYQLFSDEAREAVVTAATLALAEDAENVRVEHLRAAVEGAERIETEAANAGGIPFSTDNTAVLHRAHAGAEQAGERVELRHLRTATG